MDQLFSRLLSNVRMEIHKRTGTCTPRIETQYSTVPVPGIVNGQGSHFNYEYR